jgi:hypothetical protein
MDLKYIKLAEEAEQYSYRKGKYRINRRSKRSVKKNKFRGEKTWKDEALEDNFILVAVDLPKVIKKEPEPEIMYWDTIDMEYDMLSQFTRIDDYIGDSSDSDSESSVEQDRDGNHSPCGCEGCEEARNYHWRRLDSMFNRSIRSRPVEPSD